MKLLPESPVEFLESLPRPPETVYIAEAGGSFGTAVLAATAKGLLSLRLNTPLSQVSEQTRKDWGSKVISDTAPFDSIIEQIRAYLDGNSTPLRATIQPVMLTPYTVDVHRCLSRIPFGVTCRYSEIAAETGKPRAARAVGSACGRNSVLLIVPCHRVVAVSGLGGFGAGLDLKKRLLEHEGSKLNKIG